MKKNGYALLICSLFSAVVFADATVDWIRSGSGTGTWSAVDADDNVFVTNWEYTSISLIKYDKFGNQLWSSNYATTLLFNYLYPSQVHTDDDGNAIVVGYRYTAPTEGRNANAVIVLKYDPDGNLVWENIINGTFSLFNNSSYRTNVSSVMDTLSNVYIGTAGNVSGYPTTGFNAIKITPAGAIAWVSAVNMTGENYHFVSNIRLNGSRLVLSGHNSYWLANAAIWVLDTSGNSKWFHTETGIGGADAMIDNGGRVYLLSTTAPGYASDISLYRYKSNGVLQWNKTFDFGGADIGYKMQLTPDNRIAVLGYGNQTGISLYVDWLTMKFNLNGVLLWSKRYDEHHNNDEIPGNFAIDTDGDIFVTGIGGPFPGGSNLGARQFVTIKYTSNGTLKWTFAQDTITEYATGRHISIDSRGNLFVVVDANALTYHLLDNAGTAPCSIPLGVTASVITDESALISWSAVDNAYLYHVQYKTTTSPTWSSVSTDNINATLTGLFTGTVYQYKVEAVCNSGPTGYSAIQEFTTTGASYCASGGSNAASDWIDLVYVNDLLNSTPESAGGYSDFTYLSADLEQGSTYSFTLSAGMAGGTYFEYWKVWIDFNGDGDFADAGENIVSYSSNQIGWESHDFTVPLSASAGSTLMRVSMKRGPAPAACGTFAKGETEDYTIHILPAKIAAGGQKQQLLVYPNPAQEILHIQSDEVTENSYVQIFDLSGQEVLHMGIEDENAVINIAALQAGVYILRISDQSGNSSMVKFSKN